MESKLKTLEPGLSFRWESEPPPNALAWEQAVRSHFRAESGIGQAPGQSIQGGIRRFQMLQHMPQYAHIKLAPFPGKLGKRLHFDYVPAGMVQWKFRPFQTQHIRPVSLQRAQQDRPSTTDINDSG